MDFFDFVLPGIVHLDLGRPSHIDVLDLVPAVEVHGQVVVGIQLVRRDVDHIELGVHERRLTAANSVFALRSSVWSTRVTATARDGNDKLPAMRTAREIASARCTYVATDSARIAISSRQLPN